MIVSRIVSKPPRASWVYWTVQGAGWSLYAVANTFLFSSGQMPTAGAFARNFALSAVGLGLTHLLRRAVRRGQWLTRPMSYWLPRCLAAVLSFAALLALTLAGLAMLTYRPGTPVLPLSAMVGVTFNFAFLFSLWVALYVGFQLTIRWRGAELDRLNALATAQRAELQLLRAKLEPHFLFNALNTITSLVDEDPELARDAIRRLSHVLRATLTVDALALAPFATEWALTRDYLQLEELRFPHRLRIQASLPDEIMNCRVPTFSLQTVVENAIKHGINRQPGQGFVEITGTLKGGALCVQVRNKGWLTAPSPDSTQVGLETLRERLSRLCGAGSSATLAEEPEGCVTATLVIPQTS